MSVAQIMKELPKLTPDERRAIERRIRELEDDEMLFLNEALDMMLRDMDKEEEAHATRKVQCAL